MAAQTSAYETFIIEKHLKDSIIDQAKVQYGALHPQGHDWSVVLEEGTGHDKWIAHAAVYTSPDSPVDRVFLDQSDEIWNSTLALLDPLSELQGNLRASMDHGLGSWWTLQA